MQRDILNPHNERQGGISSHSLRLILNEFSVLQVWPRVHHPLGAMSTTSLEGRLELSSSQFLFRSSSLDCVSLAGERTMIIVSSIPSLESFLRHTLRLTIYHPAGKKDVSCMEMPDVFLLLPFRQEYCLEGLRFDTIGGASAHLPGNLSDLFSFDAFKICLQWIMAQVLLDRVLPGKASTLNILIR